MLHLSHHCGNWCIKEVLFCLYPSSLVILIFPVLFLIFFCDCFRLLSFHLFSFYLFSFCSYPFLPLFFSSHCLPHSSGFRVFPCFSFSTCKLYTFCTGIPGLNFSRFIYSNFVFQNEAETEAKPKAKIHDKHTGRHLAQMQTFPSCWCWYWV